MGSRERKTSTLNEKLQQLRAATHSSSVNKTSIVVDASKYIGELKQKVANLNQAAASNSQTSAPQNSLPMVVEVETLERGFLINVFSEQDCPGLLVSILEAFEELGLDLHDATVSCSNTFRLEAVGDQNESEAHGIDAQIVKQAVLQAIKNWSDLP